MAAFNVVRFKVKPGKDQAFIDAHKKFKDKPKGAIKFNIIKTGDRTYCAIGEWDRMASMVEARPQMIKMLDSFRDTLEDLGGGLGVTDPVSGETVVDVF
jgi:hypothetical protein